MITFAGRVNAQLTGRNQPGKWAAVNIDIQPVKVLFYRENMARLFMVRAHRGKSHTARSSRTAGSGKASGLERKQGAQKLLANNNFSHRKEQTG